MAELRSMCKSKNKGKTKRKTSIFSTQELLQLPHLNSTADFTLVGHVISLGGFGTVATYKRAGASVSCKFLAKKACVEAKMDARMLLERQVLAALAGTCGCIPKVRAAPLTPSLALIFALTLTLNGCHPKARRACATWCNSHSTALPLFSCFLTENRLFLHARAEC